MDVIKLLKKDHDEVDAMFEEFEGLGEGAVATRAQLAARICRSLEAHALIEETLFYPALEGASETSELVKEAHIEHDKVKTHIATLKELDAGDDSFDARMKSLREDVEHHVEEEEDEIFPAARTVLGDQVETIGDEALQMQRDLMPERFPPEAEEHPPPM